jgi:hypothetical protein
MADRKSTFDVKQAWSAGSVKPRAESIFSAVPFVLPSYCGLCQNLVHFSQLDIKLSYFCLQLLHFLLHATVMQDDALILTQHSITHDVADHYDATTPVSFA